MMPNFRNHPYIIGFFKTVPFLVCLTLSALAGCTATHTAINKRQLDVQTRMSASIFLDPMNTQKKTIYVQIRNTSDKPEMNLENSVVAHLVNKGYQVVERPEEAQLILQANILQVGRADLRALDHALNGGFGAALGGAAVGAAVGSLSHSREGVVAGGVVGAAVSTVTDAMIQDVVFCVIADVQVSERVGNSIVVKEKTTSKLRQGERGHQEITSTEKIAWKRFQTRIVSTANKVNLKFEKAAPALTQGLTRSIGGIF